MIATKVGCLPEVVIDNETGYLVEPRNPEEIAEAIVRFYERESSKRFVKNIRQERDKFSWDIMVQAIESFLF